MRRTYNFILAVLILFAASACEKLETDFGFDGQLSGMVKDAEGNVICGDKTNNTYAIKVLGKDDDIPLDIRVDGDGNFRNTKLFPAKSKIWVKGPVLETDTVFHDFSKNKTLEHVFVLTPFFRMAKPEIIGQPTSNAVTISYGIVANSDTDPKKKEVYCSTVPYPNGSSGSGYGYSTVKVSLSEMTGNVEISGLQPGTKYYLRTGAQASLWNFSEQISFTTPN